MLDNVKLKSNVKIQRIEMVGSRYIGKDLPKCPKMIFIYLSPWKTFQKSGSVTFVGGARLMVPNCIQKLGKTNKQSMRYLKKDWLTNGPIDRQGWLLRTLWAKTWSWRRKNLNVCKPNKNCPNYFLSYDYQHKYRMI